MASKPAIATALKGLSANYNRELDPDLPAIWHLALSEVTDDQLNAAVARLVGRSKFFPTIADVRDALGLNDMPLPDVREILDRIRGLMTYHERTGEQMPTVERVRRALGDAIADAYGFVGPHRLEAAVFGANLTGADIAWREFATELKYAQSNGRSLTLPPLAEMYRLAYAIRLRNVLKLMQGS